MIELKRINDICPVCGCEFKNIGIRFKNGVAVAMHADCVCGYASYINEARVDQVTEEDAIDKWNRVNHE